MKSIFWDCMRKWHEEAHKCLENGAEGYAAVLYLGKLLEPRWNDLDTPRHPLLWRLRAASERHYEWLIHYAAKIRALENLEGFDLIIKRLANPNEYPGALAELESALRFHLAGFEVSFQPLTQDKGFDLAVTLGDETIAVEVTTVNPTVASLAEQVHSALMNALVANRVLHGGTIYFIDKREAIEGLLINVEEAVKRCQVQQICVRIREPNVANLWIAPKGLAHLIPEEWRGVLEFEQLDPRPHPVKLAAKIKRKAHQLASIGRPGLLILYDPLMEDEVIQAILRCDRVFLGIDMSDFPNLLSTALVVPPRFWSKQYPPERHSSDFRLYLSNQLPDDENERVIIWRNPAGDESKVGEVTAVFEDYLKNLREYFDSLG